MDGPFFPGEAFRWSVSLVVPAYNEEARIRQAVSEATEALRALSCLYELLVVDDGSTDRTSEIVSEMAQVDSRICLLRHNRHRGYGSALRTGFEAAQYERVAFIHADCQFYLGDLVFLLSLTDQSPVAVGYRRSAWECLPRRSASQLLSEAVKPQAAALGSTPTLAG